MSWNKDNLKKAFEKAGLTLEFAQESFARGNNANDIFGLDIRRKTRNRPDSEYFLMWPGHEENVITIRDTDKSFGQVVLTIQEPEREFEETITKWQVRARLSTKDGKLDPQKAINSFLNHFRGYPKLKKWNKKTDELVLINRTPKDSRTFLLGMDERQLFMTQVERNVTTVAAAHASLKTPTVTFFEGKAAGKTIRQGEWFFINLPDKEREDLETALKKNQVSALKKVPIGRFAGRSGGKPHTADELVVWNGVLKAPVEDTEKVGLRRLDTMAFSPVSTSRNEVYVRGAVKHLDHETVKFSQWRKVIANAESRVGGSTGSAASTGGSWVD